MTRHEWVRCCALAVLAGVLVADRCIAQAAATGDVPIDELAERLVRANVAPIPCLCAGEESDSAQRIKQALGRPLTSAGLDFVDAPLEIVVQFLIDEYKIPIVLDAPELADANIDASEPVTVNLRNITLRSALRIMLSQLDSTYVIQDEVLLITSQQRAEELLVTCVYDIRELLDGTDDDEVSAVVRAIRTCIAPDTWGEKKGGNPAIVSLPPGLLVIRQTQAAHEQITSLLDIVRNVARDGSVNTLRPGAGVDRATDGAAGESPFSDF